VVVSVKGAQIKLRTDAQPEVLVLREELPEGTANEQKEAPAPGMPRSRLLSVGRRVLGTTAKHRGCFTPCTV